MGIASLQNEPYLVVQESKTRVKNNAKDNAGTSVSQDKEFRIFNQGCTSTNDVYDIPAIYNFDNQGPDITFILSVSPKYFQNNNPEGKFNLLPPSYKRILNNSEDDISSAQAIKREVKVSIDGQTTPLVSNLGIDKDEIVKFARFINVENRKPYNPYLYQGFLNQEKSNKNKALTPWADLVNDGYNIGYSYLNKDPKSDKYRNLLFFSLSMASTYNLMTQEKIVNGKPERIPIEGKTSKLKIVIDNNQINLDVKLNNNVKQGAKYKWELSCINQ